MGRILVFIMAVMISACSFQGLETVKDANSLNAVQYTPSNLTQAIRAAANKMVLRNPTQSEYDMASSGVDGYVRVIEAYLADPRFASPEVVGSDDPELNPQNSPQGSKGGALLREHRNYFELAGQEGGGTTINRNEPANIATYIVINDRPYWEVLTATYCVDDDFVMRSPCNTFQDQATADANAAGVLTTRAFIYKNKTPFNFHIVNVAFQKFLCSEYPDGEDPGMPKALVSDRRKTFTSNNNGGMDCFFCHRSINPKAYLFFNYYNNNPSGMSDMQGRYTPDGVNSASGVRTTDTDMGGRALPEDLLCLKNADGSCRVPSSAPVMISGESAGTVRDLGKIMAKDPRFARCAVQHYVNWIFGLGYKTKLPDEMNYLVDVFRGSPDNKPYNVKRLLVEIAKSAKFVNR